MVPGTRLHPFAPSSSAYLLRRDGRRISGPACGLHAVSFALTAALGSTSSLRKRALMAKASANRTRHRKLWSGLLVGPIYLPHDHTLSCRRSQSSFSRLATREAHAEWKICRDT